MKRMGILIVISGLCLFCQFAQADWTPAKRLTWTAGDSFYPAIAAGPSGRVHLVWQESVSGNFEIYYKRSTDGGATWLPSQRLTWTSYSSEKPAIAVDPSGHVHVVWSDYATDNWEIIYKRSTNGGATWSANRRLTWTSGYSDRPFLLADSSGNLYLVWHDYYAPGNPEIYFKKSTDGGFNWTASQRLTFNAGESTNSSLSVDSSGCLHVFWNDKSPGNFEIYHKKTTDGGATWSAGQRLTWTAGDSYVPVAAVDTSGDLHLFFHDYTLGPAQIYYKKSTNGGATWSASQRLTWNSGASYMPSIVIDSGGTLHLVWKYYNTGENNVYYKKSTDGGASWTSGQRLTWTAGTSGEHGFTIDLSNNLHLVWEDFAPGNADIYYRKGQ
jgi:BNR repeat-like domain